jgi:RNA polymerase sigma-70 factor (ECF subfamily)
MNRAIAVAELHGPTDGLAALAALDAEPLDGYQPYHAALADLLTRAGRSSDAIVAYDRAIELTTNGAERRFLIRQRAVAAARNDTSPEP